MIKTKYEAIDSYYADGNELFLAGMGTYNTLEEAKVQVIKAASAYRADSFSVDIYNDSNGMIAEVNNASRQHWLYTKKVTVSK